MAMNNPDLIAILGGSTPTTIEEVVDAMVSIDNALPSDDGLKWFNLLYLMVTREVLEHPPQNGWLNANWIAHLDVVFANLYFAAINNLVTSNGAIPSSWSALFEARNRLGIDRIQFALAGMNAHINRDLPFALEKTNEDLGVDPGPGSPERRDFQEVNDLLEAVLPRALEFLATGPLGEIAQDSGKVGRLLAMWKVRKARETGWDNSNILEHTRALPVVRRKFIAVLDNITGMAGRGLLLPLQ
jgi:Family of unknown function (DUF5995)